MEPSPEKPLSIGVLLFPAFEALDVFGPLAILNALSRTHPMTLSLLSTTLDPVSTVPKPIPPLNTASPGFGQSIVPTHTLSTAPALDILLVPGGAGTRDLAACEPLEDFVIERYHTLTTLITVCTGSLLLARTHLLDNLRATTNKFAFLSVAAVAPLVQWIPQARWVVDGNIWTSAGVSAGMDITLAWVESVWGTKEAERLAVHIEYEWHRNRGWDPFAEVHGLVGWSADGSA